MNRYLINISLLLLFVFAGEALAQRGDPNLRRIGYHTGNRVGISFYNDGQISGFNQGVDIRGEWPLGSGENYIGDLIPLIGVEFSNNLGEVKHSVTISRGPRRGQMDERHPIYNYFWGWNPVPGYLNPASQSVAMSHLPDSWPVGGWADQPTWKDPVTGKTQWNGYFGRGIIQADQESYYWADDNMDDEFNGNFLPDSRDTSRKGMGLRMGVRGFQWSSFLAANSIFWLYDIKNEGTTVFRKADFGTVVGTLAGGDGDSQDDLGSFDINNWITYSWDADGIGNKGQKVGYVGYAFLESPGNPFDGVDNDDDSGDPNSPRFVKASFDSLTYNAGDIMILIDPNTYERTKFTVQPGENTVTSLGNTTTFTAGVTYFREGHIKEIVNGVSIPDETAYDGYDNDFDGLIDENEAIHFEARRLKGLPGLKYKDYKTGQGVNDLMIDERRDNDAGTIVTSWIKKPDGSSALVTHWSGDENGNWVAKDPGTGFIMDDVGTDGLGPFDEGYPGPDPDGTEGNGRPDQGEPNFGRTDIDESDQIGLTSFNFFENSASPDLSQDELLWTRMYPGRFDVIPPQPMDGDFIYASGYFPMAPDKTERFSVSLLFGQDYADVVRQKNIVQQIYNAGYKFPQPPRKPKITITQDDGKVIIYWDPKPVENSIDFISKTKDFEGYKIYRASDAGFIDARTITNAYGVLFFNKPLKQYDIKGNGIKGFFYPRPELLEQLGGVTYYLGDDTTGLTNRFIDSTATKGVTYYYAVTAYDRGDSPSNIFPSENSTYIFRTNTGEIITDDNTGYITPGARPIGYEDASLEALAPEYQPRGTGKVRVEVIDQNAIKPDYTYRLVFADTSLQKYTESWSILNLTTGDTVVNRSTIFGGSTPIVDGFRLQIANDEAIKLDTLKSGWYSNMNDTVPSARGDGSATHPKFTFATFSVGLNQGTIWGDDYYVEFSADTTFGMSIADTLVPPTAANRFPARNTNFKIRRVADNSEVPYVYYRTGSQSTVHNIYFKETINGNRLRTWRLNIFMDAPNAPLPTSGYLKAFTKKPFSSDDSYRFSMKASAINNAEASNEMDKIKVVPNPYVVTHQGEARLLSTQTSGRGEREIRFTHVPPGSVIKIFTVKGELVKTLDATNLYVGDVYWNLRTEENLDAAFGMYVYTVEIPNVGTKIGKFALIK
ncbi:MAG: hypothetical protein LC102_02060 [Ignavibacteriales bacterium]|jgi:hypothetical protein|nr:MAG: hypothetical protein F9K26_04200 [Ignavibacteriaceae bacterium]MBW7873507.1 hypothetical protein [Ignavibacteria bacterium]MCZ2142198.1 hypothetical protein [Ignavibacteriales bacterium]MBV6444933.1 hypothetical protein [Ignavibacteriaceae bacterium]MBZ0196701.1 hypothetical protein [Ignavibacteriaceae bacterium]